MFFFTLVGLVPRAAVAPCLIRGGVNTWEMLGQGGVLAEFFRTLSMNYFGLTYLFWINWAPVCNAVLMCLFSSCFILIYTSTWKAEGNKEWGKQLHALLPSHAISNMDLLTRLLFCKWSLASTTAFFVSLVPSYSCCMATVLFHPSWHHWHGFYNWWLFVFGVLPSTIYLTRIV